MAVANTTPIPVDTPEARRYNRIRRWLSMADLVLGFAFLVVLLVTGWSGALRDYAVQLAPEQYSIQVFFYVLMLLVISKILAVGVDYYGFRLEHRYHLSNQKLRSWIWDELKGWLLGLVLGTLLVELLYFTIRQSPQHWWIVAWFAFMALLVLFAQIAPIVFLPLFYKFEPLENDNLKDRLIRLSERAGTRVRGVYEWKLSEKSKKANAALTGLGATRRIILADTLLQNYSDDEIEAVLAHELGHHVHKHILKSIAVQAGITLLGFWAANTVLHYAMERSHLFETMSDFANLPLLVLVSTVLSFLLMPILNSYSRFNERQADRYCFQSITTVAPFISSMNKLAEQNLAERAPGKWVEWFFHSHPAIAKRVAAAEDWARTKSYPS
ncbi:MAG: M48 family metallopeptidase [Acidobacteriota bacterium]|jgi:Zn-dependent protease with chaperone function|nr:M48 family metallopeptidase [Terriglobales bacterium]